MVQQVASLKTESAASALPLNANAFSASLLNQQSQSAQSFNAEFLRQTQQLDSNRQPYTGQLKSVTPSKPYNDSSNLRDDTIHSNRREPITDRRDDNISAQERQRDEMRSNRQDNQGNEPQQSRQSENAQQRAAGEQAKRDDLRPANREMDKSEQSITAKDKAQSEQDVIDSNKTKFANKGTEKVEEQTTKNDIANQLESSDKSKEISDDEDFHHYGIPDTKFDYISFVTELAEIGQPGTDTKDALSQQSVDGVLPTLVTENQLDTNDLVIEELTTSIGELISDTNQLNSDALSTAQQQQEFANINLSIEDLQTILDAKNIKLDLNAKLSDGELNDLQAIISDMLNQLRGQEDADQSNDALQDLKNADQALLASLLIGAQSAEGGQTKASIESQQELNKTSASVANAKLAELGRGTDKPTDKIDDISTANTPTTVLTNKIDDVPENAKVLTDILVPKVVVTNDKPQTKTDINDTNKTPLQNLAALNEEQTRIALDNVKQRIQNISAEVSGEKAGNEFIAALQSGVKEFKQQLANGREPGIDLKAIISDALAAANIDVSTKMPKIDAAINQINSVMNLANAVNQSASIQQAQLLNNQDLNISKELAQLSVESSKSASAAANNATSQANAQAAADKAVNIFKQEGQKQLAEKVRWMVNNKSASAEIRLDPPDLGGVNIKVSMNGDNAQVNFNVQSTAAKEALDQAVPRLREMLQEQGIELGQSSVQQDSSQQQNDNGSDSFANSEKSSGNGMQMANEESQEQEIGTVVEQRISGGSLGGIDYYA